MKNKLTDLMLAAVPAAIAVFIAIVFVLMLLGAGEAFGQTYTPAPPLIQTIFNDSGSIAANGTLTTYLTGTSTPATTYSTGTGTANSNPVQLDSSGRASVYLDPTVVYRFLVKDSSGNTLYDKSGIQATLAASFSGTSGAIPKFTSTGLSIQDTTCLSEASTRVTLSGSCDMVANTVIGGTAVGSSVTIKTTTGVGTTDAWSIVGGNNGATTYLSGNSGSTTAGVRFLVPNGTAAAPAITFTNSSTTGFFRSSADVIGVAIAGASRYTFNGAGTGLLFTNDNADDIGASGATRPRSLYLGSDINVGDQLIVAGVGPHAIGGTTNANYQTAITGAFTGGTQANGIGFLGSFAPSAGANHYSLALFETIIENSSGVHDTLVSLEVSPGVTAGAATTTNLIGVNIESLTAASGTTNAIGLKVALPTTATNNYTIVADLPDNLTEDGAVCINSANAFSDETDGVCDASSMRVKDLISEMPYGVDTVMKMRPIIFKYKTDFKPDYQVHRAGFYAEEMNALVPEVVTYGRDGLPDGIDYGKLTAVTVKAIQELKLDNDSLRARIAELEAR